VELFERDIKTIWKHINNALKEELGRDSVAANFATREINLPLVDEARRRDGAKGYVTDLNIPAQQVIDAYHQLFQVENPFRMSKSDLKTRPVFHHKRDSIEAHLSIEGLKYPAVLGGY